MAMGFPLATTPLLRRLDLTWDTPPLCGWDPPSLQGPPPLLWGPKYPAHIRENMHQQHFFETNILITGSNHPLDPEARFQAPSLIPPSPLRSQERTSLETGRGPPLEPAQDCTYLFSNVDVPLIDQSRKCGSVKLVHGKVLENVRCRGIVSFARFENDVTIFRFCTDIFYNARTRGYSLVVAILGYCPNSSGCHVGI